MHRFIFILVLLGAAVLLFGLSIREAPPQPPAPIVLAPFPPAGVPVPPPPVLPAAPKPAAPAPWPAVPPVPQEAPAPAPKPAAPAFRSDVPPPPPPSDRLWEEPAYGKTKNDAEQVALDLARQSVEEYLERRFHDIGWKPTSDDLLQLDVVRIDVQPPDPKLEGPRKESYLATAHVDVSDPNLRKLQVKVDEARRTRLEPIVSQRHLLVGRILGSFVALFLVIFGYIKLEELTRGYYTTLLRMGAGAVVLLAVLGLFLAF